jgi:hypothetical protein
VTAHSTPCRRRRFRLGTKGRLLPRGLRRVLRPRHTRPPTRSEPHVAFARRPCPIRPAPARRLRDIRPPRGARVRAQPGGARRPHPAGGRTGDSRPAAGGAALRPRARGGAARGERRADGASGGGCGPLDVGVVPTPLAEPGVRRSFDPVESRQAWLFVGVALGGDGIVPAFFAGPCGSRWISETLGARTARLAPEVSGRDTNLTFTTARAARPASAGSTGVVGAVLEHLLSRPAKGEGEARAAKPRAAGDGAAASPRSSEPAGERQSEPAREARPVTPRGGDATRRP